MKEDRVMFSKRARAGSVVALSLCGMLGLQPAIAAAAEHMIGVVALWDQPSCATPPANTAYFIEAWGYDAFGTRVCQLIVHPSVPIKGYGQCNSPNPLFPATQHAPRITLRSTSTYQFVQELPTSPAVPAMAPWTVAGTSPVLSPTITHTIPKHGTCPDTSILAASFGFDTP
jgi:hypothetical protein